jgi:diacylglycerol kinase (ATP)
MNPADERQAGANFSVVKRLKSFNHAGRGLWLFVRTTHNAWVHIAVFIAAILLGFYFQVTATEWMMVILAAGLVLVAEAFNTAIEIDIDLTSPQYHPYAKDTKDVAAAAVLIAALIAAAIGVIIFYPYIASVVK